MSQTWHPGWICTGCAKITSSHPFGRCHDCGSIFREATREDALCDRCSDRNGKRLLDRRNDHDRLCEPCIQELDLRDDATMTDIHRYHHHRFVDDDGRPTVEVDVDIDAETINTDHDDLALAVVDRLEQTVRDEIDEIRLEETDD